MDLEIDKQGALAMGRENFIAAMFTLDPIKAMGKKGGEKYLNKIYDGFEGAECETKSDKPDKSIRGVRKR